MKRLTTLLLGASILATQSLAGSVSNVTGTLDVTVVDPEASSYPHFVCASGCNNGGGLNSVSQSGIWNVGVSNWPSVQPVTGTVSVLGGATSANQPGLNSDGGGLAHVTNFPSVQPVNGTVSIGNFPAAQTVNGAVSILNFPASQQVTGTVVVPGVATAANQPTLNSDGGSLEHVTNFPSVQSVTGTVSVGNFPATQSISGGVSITNFPANQTVSGTVSVPGVATAANQPALNADGGASAHIMNWPSTQSVNGTVVVSNLLAVQPVSGSVTVGNLPAVQAISGSAGTSMMQGTGPSNANSLNVYVGGEVGVGPPSTATQAAVAYFVQTTPTGVPVDPTVPLVSISVNSSNSVANANTFQVLLLQSSARRGCAFQNTSTDIEFVNVGDSTASATKARSFQVQPGGYWYCSQSSGLVISDLLNVAGPTVGDTFVLVSQ